MHKAKDTATSQGKLYMMSTSTSRVLTTGDSLKKFNIQHCQTKVTNSVENQLKIAHDVHHMWIGPMPPQQFLDDFLPCGDAMPKCPTLSEQLFSEMPNHPGMKEKEMYPPFVSLVYHFCCNTYVCTNRLFSSDQASARRRAHSGLQDHRHI